ncbi:MAG TPA: protein DpdF, partial [Bacillales bacterium]|nr:protein DpdF [Bacillales bacterium]
MSDLVGIVQELLLKEISASEGENRLQDAVKALTDQRMRSQSTCVVRLARCLASLEKDEGLASWYDMAGHLRQVILMHHRRLTLHQDYADELRSLADGFRLSIDHSNEVNASVSFPSWLEYGEHMQRVFNLEKRNEPKRRIGDGILHHMTGFSEYTSEEQKTLVQASMNMGEGETLLACLPTGGGKSLIGQMPAYFETQGGMIHGGVARGGTTVVIVPTVALALDQYRSACSFFHEALSEEHQPQAYYGGMDDHKKEVIYNGLQNGTLPILFTSPEAVLNGGLYRTLMKAASQGKLKRLVIDEAHIVVDWGGAFRTDFQFLAVLQNKLLEASGHRLKTVLLSATLTNSATKTLIKLFSNGENLTEIRSDALRFEPIYFLDRSKDVRKREDKIREILPLLPRPLILYVSKLEDASKWEKIIRETGFQSVAVFTGETSSNDRKAILEHWNENQLDMIVATSAFGMGVDKPDIRTVIHCCLPESVNRYYQEVGRGGRDGFASISLLCVTEEELQSPLAMNNVLTVEKLVERWDRMRKKRSEVTSGDTIWIRMDTRPNHLKNQETGGRNARWNEAALLFLYREGFIDILDIRKKEDEFRRQIHIKMLNLEHLQDRQKLAEKLEPVRQMEVNKLRYEYQKMKHMVETAEKNCLSD